ncbi:hypothetical protein D8Y24_10570 [Agrococcus lahaulensis]|nr:hypothetical protein D8Y24_10570 [Agrococcus lahaulensis]
MDPDRYGPSWQRNALAPGFLGALALIVAQLLLETEWFGTLRFVIAVLAIIVGWFAFQARQWWWVPVMLAIAVAWNPVLPFDIAGPVWVGAHWVAALAMLTAAALIKAPRDDDRG